MIELAPHVLVLLALAACLAGFIDSIAGGGGLIAVPALLAAGLPPVVAIATNKAQSAIGTGSATYTYWRAGMIDFSHLRAPLLAVVVGAALGALALTVVGAKWLMVLLPVLLLAIAVYFLAGPKATDMDRHARLKPLAYSFIAGGVGFYDGFFGPGAGSFFALSLVTLMGMGLTRATAHTKALNLMSNLIGVTVLATGGHVLWTVAACMAAGQFVGGRLGSKAAMRFGPRLIRPLLVVISVGMTIKLLADPTNPLRVMVEGWLHRF